MVRDLQLKEQTLNCSVTGSAASEQGWVEPSLSSLQGHSSVVVLRRNQASALVRLVKIQISRPLPQSF